MAWMASNIYVQTEDHGAVADAVAEQMLLAEQRTDQEGILDSPGPLAVWPAVEGWVAVTTVDTWVNSPPDAAAALSSKLGADVVCCELVANSYRMRLGLYRDGKRSVAEQLPEDGWTGDPLTDPEPKTMPIYQDTEALAFAFLREHGVPLSLVTVGTTPLGREQAAPLKLPGGVTLEPDGDEVERGEMEFSLTPYDAGEPPSLPTNITRDFGLMLLEERFVDGEPNAAALANLLAIEQALTERAERAAPNQNVSLTVSYHCPLHQDRLDDMLRRHDRHVLPREQRMQTPWWKFWRHFGLGRG